VISACGAARVGGKLFESGRHADALAAAEEALVATPGDATAALVVGRALQELGRYNDALRHAEMLTKNFAGVAAGWELAVQLYQQLDMRDRRDSALARLISAQTSSLDRDVRMRPFVVRDRIVAGGRVLQVRENFETGARDFVKYQFVPFTSQPEAMEYAFVGGHEAMTQAWQEAGILPRGKLLYVLANIWTDAAGLQRQAIHATFPELPDYDTIRAKVVELVEGRSKPMSGAVGGIAVPLGR
jgi:tetratricopeptide (TPR) repeat protein